MTDNYEPVSNNIILRQEKTQYYVKYNTIFFGIQALGFTLNAVDQWRTINEVDPETDTKKSTVTSATLMTLLAIFFVGNFIFAARLYNKRINRKTVKEYKDTTVVLHICIIVALINYIILTLMVFLIYIVLVAIAGDTDNLPISGFPTLNYKEKVVFSQLSLLFFR